MHLDVRIDDPGRSPSRGGSIGLPQFASRSKSVWANLKSQSRPEMSKRDFTINGNRDFRSNALARVCPKHFDARVQNKSSPKQIDHNTSMFYGTLGKIKLSLCRSTWAQIDFKTKLRSKPRCLNRCPQADTVSWRINRSCVMLSLFGHIQVAFDQQICVGKSQIAISTRNVKTRPPHKRESRFSVEWI